MSELTFCNLVLYRRSCWIGVCVYRYSLDLKAFRNNWVCTLWISCRLLFSSSCSIGLPVGLFWSCSSGCILRVQDLVRRRSWRSREIIWGICPMFEPYSFQRRSYPNCSEVCGCTHQQTGSDSHQNWIDNMSWLSSSSLMQEFYILWRCFHKLDTLICGCTFRSQQKALHQRLGCNICYRHNLQLLMLYSFEWYLDNLRIWAYWCIIYDQLGPMVNQFYHSATRPT